MDHPCALQQASGFIFVVCAAAGKPPVLPGTPAAKC